MSKWKQLEERIDEATKIYENTIKSLKDHFKNKGEHDVNIK